MPVANCHQYQWHRRQIGHRCRWHRWHIMGTISGCRHLKLNLKAKIYIYINSTTQRCPNKIIKILQLEDFCHLPPVSTTPVGNLELQRSPRIFKKIWNGPIGIIRGLGDTDSWKKPKAKNLVTLPLLKTVVICWPKQGFSLVSYHRGFFPADLKSFLSPLVNIFSYNMVINSYLYI